MDTINPQDSTWPLANPEHLSGIAKENATSTTHLKHPKYRADIDGLRAIAVLSVVGFHAFPNWVKGGFVGVDIFFVISGFLISTIIFENVSQNTFSFIEFYERRIRRIFPALLTVLIACFAFGWFVLLADEYMQLGKHLVGGASFTSNLMLWQESGYFDNAAETKPLLHLWSLGIEEQFYIFWPLLIWFAWKCRANVFMVMSVIALCSFILNIYTVNSNATADFYSPLCRFWELLIGSTLAYVALYKKGIGAKYGQPYREWWSCLGIALIAVSCIVLNKGRAFPGYWALLPSIGAVLLIFAGSQAWVNRNILSNRLLVWFGLISFPLYLWHWPLLSFDRIWEIEPTKNARVYAVAASIILAWITYVLIEKPLRFGPNNKTKTLGLMMALVMVGGLGSASYLDNGFASRQIKTADGRTISAQGREEEKTAEYVSQYSPCSREEKLSDDFKEHCLVHANAGAKPKIVVWGDSHAESWQPVFETIAHKKNYELYVVSEYGCPPIEGVMRTDGGAVACLNIKETQHILGDIIKMKPDLVILTSRWSLYANGWIKNGRLSDATHFLTTSAADMATIKTSRKALVEKIPSTIKALQKEKISILVFKNPPILKDSVKNLRKPIDQLQPTMAEHLAFSKFTDQILDSLTGVAIFDPAKKLCLSICAEGVGKINFYRDDNHLTAEGALYFESELTRLIADSLPKHSG
jgi:peptidoglycan/LPS O-acetylase OafA/YrhL